MPSINTQQATQILEKMGLDTLDAGLASLVQVELIVNPTESAEQAVANVDGQLKHQARGKIGWAVDVIWDIVQPTLDAAILSVVQSQQASNAAASAASAGAAAS